MKSFFSRLINFHWSDIAWIFAVGSGYLVTTAYEVSELVKFNKKITWAYVIQKACALVVVFSLGYLLKVHIKTSFKSEDVQAGVYAMVGALGFSAFGIVYRLFANKKIWTEVFVLLVRRWIGVSVQPNNNINPSSDDQQF